MPTNRSFEQLIEDFEPRLQQAFLDAVYNLRNTAHVDQIVRMLEAGDINGALRAVGIDPIAFRPFDRSITQAFEAGGEATAAVIPAAVDAAGFRTVFQFSVRNLQAEAWLRQYSGFLIESITDDQLDAVRKFLSARLSEGANPRTTALDLVGRVGASGQREGGVIGLTSSQEGWVRAYRAELESDNPAQALTRALRDQRFDKTVLKATEADQPLPSALVDKMVTAYKNRALRYRAETIARKETITALHTAQEMALKQAIDSGVVAQTDLTYVWRTARDNRVRHSHRTMNGQVRKAGTPFTTGAGASLLYPGDPNGSPEETINCRCFREPKIDFLRGIR
jgi:hypothetical protein